MSDEEIKTFITTLKSFMQHADVEEMNYLRRESTRTVSYTHLTLPTTMWV